ncbi:MAG: hypothetical protein H7296_06780 [Bacteroidia bacterium]|nr:hypothetical protein [Bacteroidia bacterium]
MMDWKVTATIMFFPVLIMAIFICFKTRKDVLFLIPNMAVLCWLSANSLWMLGEFYEFKYLVMALFFFITGALLIFYYLFLIFRKKTI